MRDLDRKRKQSEGDVYHVVIRGVGRQILFEDDRDKGCMKSLLREKCHNRSVEVYAWCFMDNHVHLLLHSSINDISAMMRDLQAGYAKYFNKRHDRVGTLFQGRFYSVPVEDDEQLRATVSYIHRNPLEMNAGLGYKWSSYREYLGDPDLAVTGFVLEVFGSVEAFVACHEREQAEMPRGSRMDAVSEDAWVQDTLKAVLGDVNPFDVRSLSKAERNEMLRRLKDAGLSIRQIERATSIGRGIVSRA